MQNDPFKVSTNDKLLTNEKPQRNDYLDQKCVCIFVAACIFFSWKKQLKCKSIGIDLDGNG